MYVHIGFSEFVTRVLTRSTTALQPYPKSEYSFGQSLGSGACGTVKQARWDAHEPPIEVAIKVKLSNL
jgi:hypothetical protein